jgi:hypothetical protein
LPLRFQADYSNPTLNFDALIDEVFGELQSAFIEMPKGEGFIDYPIFQQGYQALKRTTDAFADVTTETVMGAIKEAPIAFIVLRCILGFTPPELAYITSELTDVAVDQGAARGIDRKMRVSPPNPWKAGVLTDQRVTAMVQDRDASFGIAVFKPPPGTTMIFRPKDFNPRLASQGEQINSADCRKGQVYSSTLKWTRVYCEPYGKRIDIQSHPVGVTGSPYRLKANFVQKVISTCSRCRYKISV